MTKPREKTREELTAEIEDGKKKIRQFENREKMLRQKLSKEERRTRSHRLIVRGAVFESIVPEAKNMTDEEAAALLISVFITSGSGRPRLPVFTSIIRPSGLWTSGHSRSRPITSRMKFSITISASRWKMARSWLGAILPIPAR